MARKYYTVQIFSSDGAIALTRRFTKTLLGSIITVACIIALGIIALVAFYGRVYVKAMKVRNLEERNKYLESEFEKIASLEEDIAKINKQREKLEVILGIQEKREESHEGITENPPIITGKASDDSADVAFENPEMGAYLKETIIKNQGIPNIAPVNGWITKRFDVIHKGVDIAAPIGTPIIATMDGIVEEIRWDSVFGNAVEIKAHSGYNTFYGHCSTIYVKRGDIIKKGDIIAGVGQSGNASAPHLHYEISKDEQKVNPELFFLKRVNN